MAVRDLNNAWDWILRLIRRIERLESGAILENSSITEGRMRFIGGLLRIDSGGRVEIVGTLEIDGNTTINGVFHLSATSDWTIDGNGVINGNVTISGNFDVTSGGKITAGNVTIEPDKITIGTGSTAATLQNGEFQLSNGAKLAVGLTGGTSSIGLIPGGGVDISANTLTAWLRAIGATISVSTSTARIAAPNVYMPDVPLKPGALATVPLVMDPTNGKIYHT